MHPKSRSNWAYVMGKAGSVSDAVQTCDGTGFWYLVPRHFSDEWGKDAVRNSVFTSKSILPKNEGSESVAIDYDQSQLMVSNPPLGFVMACNPDSVL